MEVHVRRAEKNDAPAIAEMALKLVEQHVGYDPVRFARIATLDGMTWFYGSQTDAEDARILVAEVEDQIVGFAYLSFEEKNYVDLSALSAKLHDIYIEEDSRGSSTGAKLIEVAIAEAKDLGATKILLSVAAKNVSAQKFFEKQGFRTTMLEKMLKLSF